MHNDILRKLQLTQVEMLKEIRRVCEKLNIQYFLIDGTLLGAVRHKGFIPWDDDLDIAMTRPEYEKFVKFAPNELSTEYFLQNWHSDPAYALPYSKLLMNGTKLIESVTDGTNVRSGIFVDIFPFDHCGSKKDMKPKMIPYLIWTKTLLMKSGYKVWNANGAKNSKIQYLPFILLSKFYSKKSLVKKIEKITRSWNNKYCNSEYCLENTGCNLIPWIVQKKDIESTIKIQFEDDFFCVPQNYDGYLKAVYGDYMQMPPMEDRENRHAIIDLSFRN